MPILQPERGQPLRVGVTFFQIMAKDPAFLFYPGDYLRDTQCLSENSQVAYDRIMCEHMRNICISQSQLNFFTKKLSPDEIEELKMVLTAVDGGFQISWIAESIEKRREYSDSRRKNRSSTKKDMSNISKTYDSHMENENEIVNEIVIEDKSKNETEKPKREIFRSPEMKEVLEWMRTANTVAGNIWKDEKVVAESKKFWNYYESNGWRVGKNPMKKWDAAARNWMNNANKFDNGNTTQQGFGGTKLASTTGNRIHDQHQQRAGEVVDLLRAKYTGQKPVDSSIEDTTAGGSDITPCEVID